MIPTIKGPRQQQSEQDSRTFRQLIFNCLNSGRLVLQNRTFRNLQPINFLNSVKVIESKHLLIDLIYKMLQKGSQCESCYCVSLYLCLSCHTKGVISFIWSIVDSPPHVFTCKLLIWWKKWSLSLLACEGCCVNTLRIKKWAQLVTKNILSINLVYFSRFPPWMWTILNNERTWVEFEACQIVHLGKFHWKLFTESRN